MGARTYGHEMN